VDEIPAVSSSSGRLIVWQPQVDVDEREWPGRVFEGPALLYEEAMLDFAAASQAQKNQPESERQEEQTDQIWLFQACR
jgi:hypothetical protein